MPSLGGQGERLRSAKHLAKDLVGEKVVPKGGKESRRRGVEGNDASESRGGVSDPDDSGYLHDTVDAPHADDESEHEEEVPEAAKRWKGLQGIRNAWWLTEALGKAYECVQTPTTNQPTPRGSLPSHHRRDCPTQ